MRETPPRAEGSADARLGFPIFSIQQVVAHLSVSLSFSYPSHCFETRTRPLSRRGGDLCAVIPFRPIPGGRSASREPQLKQRRRRLNCEQSPKGERRRRRREQKGKRSRKDRQYSSIVDSGDCFEVIAPFWPCNCTVTASGCASGAPTHGPQCPS